MRITDSNNLMESCVTLSELMTTHIDNGVFGKKVYAECTVVKRDNKKNARCNKWHIIIFCADRVEEMSKEIGVIYSGYEKLSQLTGGNTLVYDPNKGATSKFVVMRMLEEYIGREIFGDDTNTLVIVNEMRFKQDIKQEWSD